MPIVQQERRLPEHGRIRLGIKDNSRQGRRSIDTFRFTSHDEAVIAQLAGQFGGKPKPWTDPKAVIKRQFEVITEASRVPVILPPDALSAWMELWTGGGCVRRCDGVTCSLAQGEDLVDVPCICEKQNQLQCRETTRLSVILPSVKFGGTWRLDTKSKNAAMELAAMEEAIQGMQAAVGGGLLPAQLVVARRERVVRGKKQSYVVATLELDASPMELLAGKGTVHALAAADNLAMPALAPPPGSALWSEEAARELDDPSDIIEDAEIVEDGYDIVAAVEARFPGRTGIVLQCLEDISEGRVKFEGIDEDGKAILRKVTT